MTGGMPTQANVLRVMQAELNDLRWVATHSMETHDRSARRLAQNNPGQGLSSECPCALCRHSRPWVGADAPTRSFEEPMDQRNHHHFRILFIDIRDLWDRILRPRILAAVTGARVCGS